MVELVKHPKYVTVRSTPPPEVDLSDDLYDDSYFEDKDQLKWLVAGSVGGGTIDPSNPSVCVQGLGMVALSILNSFMLSLTVFNGVHYKTRAEEFRTVLGLHFSMEKLIILASLVLEVDKMMGGSNALFIDKLLPLTFIKRPFPFLTTLKVHALYWTPLGMTKIPEVWEECGRPGGGLGKKLMEKGKKLLAKPAQPVLAPVSANASMSSPITFTAIDPKAATEALTTTALLGIVGATILYILTLPESVAATLTLSVVQPDKEDHGA